MYGRVSTHPKVPKLGHDIFQKLGAGLQAGFYSILISIGDSQNYPTTVCGAFLKAILFHDIM